MPVVPTLMGWGTIPDDHPLMAGMVGLQTSHRYGNATMLESRLRARHRQPLGQPAHRRRRHLHRGPEVRARRHRADPDRPGLRARLRHRLRRRPALEVFVEVAREWDGRGPAAGPARRWAPSPPERKQTLQRKTNFDNVPIKPQRVYQEMNQAFGTRHPLRQHDRPVPDPGGAAAARLPAAALDQRRPGRPAGLDRPGHARRRHRRPGRHRGRAVRATTTSSS